MLEKVLAKRPEPCETPEAVINVDETEVSALVGGQSRAQELSSRHQEQRKIPFDGS